MDLYQAIMDTVRVVPSTVPAVTFDTFSHAEMPEDMDDA